MTRPHPVDAAVEIMPTGDAKGARHRHNGRTVTPPGNVMSRTVWIHGLAAGAILAATMLLAFVFRDAIGFDRGAVVGYASMVLAFSLVYFGIRSRRDSLPGQRIGFGQAFMTGAAIALVASACYVVAWQVVYHWLAPDFMQRYAEHAITRMRAEGAAEAAIAAKVRELADFAELYRNPVVNIAFTLLEVLPVGLLFALVSAGLLRRGEPARPPSTS